MYQGVLKVLEKEVTFGVTLPGILDLRSGLLTLINYLMDWFAGCLFISAWWNMSAISPMRSLGVPLLPSWEFGFMFMFSQI